MSKQFYNLVTDDGDTLRVLVSKSIQYIPYERHLTVSARAAKILQVSRKQWFCDLPTPHYPRCVFDWQ